MSIHNAIRFLREIGGQVDLRCELYGIRGREALFSRIAREGYSFTGGEFEEAVDHLHVSCRTAEEADFLMDKAIWFRMVSANAEP